MTVSSDAGTRLRIEMVRCGYTLDSLSEKSGISPAVLRGILAGRATTISTRNLTALSRLLGYSTTDFIDLLTQT